MEKNKIKKINEENLIKCAVKWIIIARLKLQHNCRALYSYALTWSLLSGRTSMAKAVIHAAADDVTFGHTGNMRLLDALIRRKLPVGLDAPDADAPDAYYPYPHWQPSLVHYMQCKVFIRKILSLRSIN